MALYAVGNGWFGIEIGAGFPRVTAVGRDVWWFVPCSLVFLTCESGSGALLGAQDNSVFSPVGEGLWTLGLAGRGKRVCP